MKTSFLFCQRFLDIPMALYFECLFLSTDDCNMRLVHGMILNPITMRWSWGSPKACNYAIHAIKNDRSQTDFDEIEETQS